MNDRGQVIFVYLMLGVLLFIIGLNLASPLNKVVNSARTNSQIDCNNASISDQNKANCKEIELMQPYFIGIIFSLVGMLLWGAVTR